MKGILRIIQKETGADKTEENVTIIIVNLLKKK